MKKTIEITLSVDQAKLLATTLHALSKSFKKYEDVGDGRVGFCSVHGCYRKDCGHYANWASEINEKFDYQLF